MNYGFKTHYQPRLTMNIKSDLVSTVPILVVSAGIIISAGVFAQSAGGDFEITRSTIDGGGGTSTGGDFSLTGTTGQADAGQHSSSGGEFSLAGGFWTGTGIEELIFKDSFEGD
jgi:hypothetical protein